jgi:hypothetical protein
MGDPCAVSVGQIHRRHLSRSGLKEHLRGLALRIGWVRVFDALIIGKPAGAGTLVWGQPRMAGMALSARFMVTPVGRGWLTTAGAVLVLVLLAGSGAWAETSGGGTQRWTSSYHEGAPGYTTATAVSPDGSTVFVTGTTTRTNFGSTGRFATLAYDARTGAEKWVDNYPGSAYPGYSTGNAIAVSPDGSTVFVTGYSLCEDCSEPSRQYLTLAYDASTGDRLWVAEYAALGGARSIALSPDGSTVFVNGSTDLGRGSATVAYAASTGEQLWAIEGDDRVPAVGEALSVSREGSTVYVAASSGAGPELPCWDWTGGLRITAHDSVDGTVDWSSTHRIASEDVCGATTGIGLSPDGSKVFVSGYGGLSDGTNTYGLAMVAFDAVTGAELWARHEEDIRVGEGDTAVPLGVSPDGSKVFMLGYDCDRPCSTQPFVTVAYDAPTGDRLWESRHDGGGRGWATDLAVSPDGSAVFVTGQETLPCFAPCTGARVQAPLVAYHAETGEVRWATSYPDNHASALAVSPDGSSVYLAGSFTGAASNARVAEARTTGRLAAGSCSGQCGYSTAGYNIGPGPGRVQDADHPPRFNGWRTSFHKTAVGGAYRTSNQVGATATFSTPRVTSVSWLTHRGPDQGMAKVFVDGRSRGTFNLYALEHRARAFTFSGLARTSHTVKVKVLGLRDPSSVGTSVAVDGFEVRSGTGIRQESSPKIRYDSWTGVSRAAASGGSYRTSRSPAASASLAFTGRTIKWITATGPAYGRARVVIDGKVFRVDLYRRTLRWQVPITFRGLPKGTHHIRVRPLGTKTAASRSTQIVVDAFVVRS